MKKHSFLFCSVFILFFSLIVTDLAHPMSIAVLPVEPLGVSKNISRITTELISTELASRKMFKLVERQKLEEVLKEQEINWWMLKEVQSMLLQAPVFHRKINWRPELEGLLTN